MRKFKKPARFLVSLICLALAFVLSVQLGDRGLQFDLRASDGAAGSEEQPPYKLSDRRILNTALLRINENYVEPDRIDPSRMLIAALEEVQNSVAEVVIEFKQASGEESVSKITVSVNTKTRIFDIESTPSLWEMSIKLKDIFAFIQESMGPDTDVKFEEIEYAAINGMLKTLDPHSTFLPPKNHEEIKTQTSGKFGGLGVSISVRDGKLTVITPIEGTPAAKKGVRARDEIVRIGGQSTINMELSDAVNLLRGEPGSKVELWLMRKGWDEPKKFEIERAIIKIESVNSQPLAKKIGYLRIKNFQSNTFKDTKRHLSELSEKMGGMQGLVLDLRGNPGGLLDQSIRISDLFIDEGVIVSTVGQGNRLREKNMAMRAGTQPKYPIVVLVDPGSASASEIVSGAIQNNDRGVVLGQTSFGKGSVQIIYPKFPNKTALKLTVAQYLTPGGISIQGRGIVPDVHVSPVTIAKGKEVDMFLSRNVLREGDLATALTNDNIAAERDGLFVRYLKGDPAVEEEFADPDAFKEDFEIMLAQKLLMASGQTWKRPEMIEAMRTELARITEKENGAIRDELSELGIDWSRGSQVIEPKYTLTWAFDPPQATPVKAGTTVNLVATFTNMGTETFHQLKAITESDSSLLGDHEYLFGKVPPGASRDFKVAFKIPQDISSRTDMLHFDLSDAHTTYNNDTRDTFPFTIEGSARPHFGFTYAIEDANKDGLLQPNEEVKVRIFVHNTGQADSPEALVYLKNRSRELADLQSGRDKLKQIKAGGFKDVAFKMKIKDVDEAGQIELELDIYDALYREYTQKNFKLPISTALSPATPITQHVTSAAAGAEIFAGASDAMPVVATIAAAGSHVAASAKKEGWIKVDFDGGSGWVKAESVSLQAGAPPEGATAIDPILAQSPIISDWTPASYVTNQSAMEVALTARDDSSIKDYYIFVHNRDVATVNTRKIKYARVDSDTLAQTPRIPLFVGMNRIAIYVRDADGMTSTRSAYVYRTP